MAAKAVAGWKRTNTQHGIVLTVQLAASASDFNDRSFEKVDLVLNERQLRSLTRDLTRAATERGLAVFADPPWWKPWARTPV